ncbi:hypothetical protein BJY00DRAFT_294573 [Aspergillus carlsbadensis]|nr:hypothetical protein BJY00DRAFT_294573 [Aspergillus carlsbadensis]
MASAYSPTGTSVASIFFLVTVWVSSALRVYVRVNYGKGPFLDDLLAVVATLLFTVYTIIFVYYQVKDLIPIAIGPTPTAGQPQAPPPPSSSRELTHRLLFICDLLYTFSTYVIKLSFTVMLLRLVQTRRQVVVLAVTIISGAILTVASVIHDLLFCRPIEYQWTRFGDPTAEGTCDAFWSRAVITLMHGSWVMLADIILGIIVPLMLLWNIRMHPRTKLSIRFLLGLGSLFVSPLIPSLPSYPPTNPHTPIKFSPNINPPQSKHRNNNPPRLPGPRHRPHNNMGHNPHGLLVDHRARREHNVHRDRNAQAALRAHRRRRPARPESRAPVDQRCLWAG